MHSAKNNSEVLKHNPVLGFVNVGMSKSMKMC